MWLSLAFLSAFLLGCYEVCKKKSLDNNAVIPVLFLNTCFCSLLFLPCIVLSYGFPELMRNSLFYVPPSTGHEHIYIIGKAALVLTSWTCAYFATKHLPITIAGPIKASQPILTLVGALLIFGEQLNLYQWIGVILAIVSFIMKKRRHQFQTQYLDSLYSPRHNHRCGQRVVRQISHVARLRPNDRTSMVLLLSNGDDDRYSLCIMVSQT
jgi:drug/metabolite transporter (DMT)-like permease